MHEREPPTHAPNPRPLPRSTGQSVINGWKMAGLEWTYNVRETRSKSRNTPFDGWKFNGGVVAAIVGGKIVFQR